jgi:hypothetical protein
MSSEIPIHGTPEQVLAFCKAFRTMQPKIPAFPRTREGQEGNRKFNYTEYDKVLEIVEPIFDEHGFFHFQNRNTVEAENGPMATVDSFLLHELGGYSHAHNEARVESKNAIREAGKAHTYFSRYGLIGLIGKTSETDQDAPEAPSQQAQKARQEPPKQQPKAQQAPGASEREKAQAKAEQQIGQLKELLRTRATSKEGVVSEKDEAAFMALVAKHSKDAHGMVPSVLAQKVEVFKLDEVLRWADENIGQKPTTRDEGFDDPRRPQDFGDRS